MMDIRDNSVGEPVQGQPRRRDGENIEIETGHSPQVADLHEWLLKGDQSVD